MKGKCVSLEGISVLCETSLTRMATCMSRCSCMVVAESFWMAVSAIACLHFDFSNTGVIASYLGAATCPQSFISFNVCLFLAVLGLCCCAQAFL